MSEDTTTSEDSVDSGADETAQLDAEDTQTEAVNQDEDTSQTSESDDAESLETEESESKDDSEETELKDWAAKKNLPLDDPLKMAKMYRESEQKLGKKGQKEGQLKTAVSNANASSDTEDYQALKNEVEALSFFVNHPEAKQFENNMVEILEEKPWLASDLEVVLDVAKGRSTSDAATRLAERKAGSKEALAQAEQAGRAAQPRASATNSAKATNQKITMDNVDQLIEANGHEWYMKNRDKINAVLAGN
jgi:hypothetical protein